MINVSDALAADTRIGSRFRVESVLGRGSFAIVYLVTDESRGDQCVVKELFPTGSVRFEGGAVRLGGTEGGSSTHLKQRFLAEARLTSQIRSNGVLPIRAMISENGTAYYATEHVKGGKTLAEALEEEGSLHWSRGLRLFTSLLNTLKDVHAAGILHRDIKPSNILLHTDGSPFLIDFGAAREWQRDLDSTQTMILTTLYAAPEQFSPKARRGPGTDIFALCATVYHLLTGEPAPTAHERASGVDLVPIESLVSDIPAAFSRTLMAGLNLNIADRPHSADELHNMLSGIRPPRKFLDELTEFDRKRLQLSNLKHDKRECPACNGVLEVVRPLKLKQCPVCRSGFIRDRKIGSNICPHCRESQMKSVKNASPIAICPVCAEGLLASRKRGLFSKEIQIDCPDCGSAFEPIVNGMRLISIRGEKVEGEAQRSASFNEWRAESGRAEVIELCQGCGAQFDVLVDGRWQQTVPTHTHRWSCLFPEEWARVAAGLKPDAGNAECDSCGSDFFVSGDKVTLTNVETDPFDFGERHLGRLCTFEQLKWLGVGKESAHEGFVCADCHTEFDQNNELLTLIETDQPHLIRYTGKTYSLTDWHRLGHELPALEDQAEFERKFDEIVMRAFIEGAIPFSEKNTSVIWKGPARKIQIDEDGQAIAIDESNLLIEGDILTFGGMLKKERLQLNSFSSIEASENQLRFVAATGSDMDDLLFEVTPIDFTAYLDSGKRTLRLTAAHLAERLQNIGSVGPA